MGTSQPASRGKMALNLASVCMSVLEEKMLRTFEFYMKYAVICRFNSQFEDGDTRFLITDAMHVGPSSILEFELVMGCHHTTPLFNDEPVRLEYSTDHGMSWSLVLEGCWPPNTCTHYHSPSVYHVVEYPHWRRVTIILPLPMWCALYSCSANLYYSWCLDNV